MFSVEVLKVNNNWVKVFFAFLWCHVSLLGDYEYEHE